MAVRTQSAGNEVNKGMGLIPGCLRGEFRVPPETYTGFDYDLKGGTSDNWDEVANALNFANHSHGWPTTEPWPECLAFAESTLDGAKPFLEKEGSILSSIYFADHTFDPRLAQYGVLRFCGLGPREADLAARLRGWLRAGVLWPAIIGLDVRPRGWAGKGSDWTEGLDHQIGVIVANGAPDPYYPPVSVCSCGGRSWSWHDRKRKVTRDGKTVEITEHKIPWYIAVSTAGNVLAEFGLGRTPNQNSGVAAALRDRFGVNPHDLLFSAEERNLILRVVRDKRDFEALRWALREIGPYLPKHPVRFLAFEVAPGQYALATVCLYHAKGATSSTAARVLYPDGRAVTLSADSLIRGTASAYNRAQSAEIDLARRMVRAWCLADENQSASEAQCELPQGELVYHFEACEAGGLVDYSPAPVLGGRVPEAEPEPAPDPTPEPTPAEMADTFDWFVHADKPTACVRVAPPTADDGFYGAYSAVRGHPNLFIERVGPGLIPWSSRLVWRDREKERVALVSECGFENGNLANFRIFFDSDGKRPGVLMFRRYLDRAKGDAFRKTGYVIEHAITSGGDPYRGEGDDLPAGQTRESFHDADTVVNHLGVTNDLGEPVAVIEMIDTMGDRKHPETREREEYRYGFNERGSYGVIWWRSFVNGVLDRMGFADGIVPDGGPCLVFGVDPEDPELHERWFCSSDYEGELPQVGPPTRRPSLQGASSAGGGSTKKRGGCALLLAVLGLASAAAAVSGAF